MCDDIYLSFDTLKWFEKPPENIQYQAIQKWGVKIFQRKFYQQQKALDRLHC